MSKLLLKSEPLNRVLEGNEISLNEAYDVFDNAKKNTDELFKTARVLRQKNKGNSVTFSKKAFFNIVNLCKDTCSYCTYKSEPNESKLSMMSKNEVTQLCKQAKKFHCVEALLVTGERPEQKYSEAKHWLKSNGFNSTAEYLIHCSELALSFGLFPHTNGGNFTKSEMKELKKTNVSIGIMLENVSERLSEKEMPHFQAPSKRPKARLETLQNAGELEIPITTGLLIGIGETPFELIESIYAIKKMHEKYGNIQEIILQNFQPKLDTKMKDFPSAEENYFKRIVAISRIILPNSNIQIPPNLSPKSYQSFLSVGINDWGGISPLTPDYVNPEFVWPQIKEVEQNSKQAGFELKARFPVYPEFLELVNSDLKEKMKSIQNDEGLVREKYWR